MSQSHTRSESRFTLPTVSPTRITVRPRDLIQHRGEQSLGWITPDGSRVEWFEGLLAGTTESVENYALDIALECGTVDVIAGDVEDPDSCWWLGVGGAPANAVRTSQLSLRRERSRNAINAFLEHPVVDHDLGGVVGWKAAFGARYRGDLVAVCVLSRPTARGADDGLTVELNRYAAHPKRPANTASWLISRAARWAALEGYDQLLTYAGVSNDNEGVIYQASNFERDGVTTADGSGWESRADRESREDYTRRRYIRRLHDDPQGAHRVSSDTESTSGTSTSLSQFTSGGKNGSRSEYMVARADGRESAVSGFFETHDESPSSSPRGDEAAVFAARTASEPVAMLAVSNISEAVRRYTDARVDRLAVADVDYPTNVGARLIAKAREWAALEGFDMLHPPETPTEVEAATCKQAGLTASSSLEE
jgi:GNAT superfamily N-acetyltransferase